jgi:hypothetical protein
LENAKNEKKEDVLGIGNDPWGLFFFYLHADILRME